MSFIINPYRHAGGGGATNGLLTGLESYYKLDEASGTIADSHGSNDSVSVNGSPTYGATGVINDCMSFDGTDDDISFGDVLDFERTDPFSVSMWVNFDADSSYEILISKIYHSASPLRGWEIQRDGSGKIIFQFISTWPTNAIDVISTTATIDAADGWTHLLMTYDGSSSASGVTIYLDGSSIALTTNKDTLSATTINTDSLLIGTRENLSGFFFGGDMDEVGIWSRELTALEVLNLYKGGAGMPYSEFTS